MSAGSGVWRRSCCSRCGLAVEWSRPNATTCGWCLREQNIAVVYRVTAPRICPVCGAAPAGRNGGRCATCERRRRTVHAQDRKRRNYPMPCWRCGRIRVPRNGKSRWEVALLCTECRRDRPPLVKDRTRRDTPRPWLRFVPDRVVGPMLVELGRRQLRAVLFSCIGGQ